MRSAIALFAATLCALSVSIARADPVADALGSRCTRDDRLSAAASRALRDPLGFDVLELRQTAWSSGLRAPTVYALVLRGGDAASSAEAVSRWLARHAVSPSLSRCALASNAEGLAVALAPRALEVTSAPLVGGRAWRVSLPPGVTDPALLASSPDGDVRRVPIADDGSASLALDARGAWTLQVIATLPTGPAPLAMWTETVESAAAPIAPDVQVWSARNLLGAINELRVGAGVTPLRRDPMLDRIAEGHAARLAASGSIAHTPTADDSPVDRLRLAGVLTSRVAENLARAQTLSQAHANLARSPSHRANLLDARVDAVGLGVARSSGEVYLVEVFAAAPSLGP